MLFFVSFSFQSQCENTSQYGSAVAPTTGTATISTCNYLSEFSPITGVAASTGYICDITMTGVSTGYVTIRDAANNPVAHGPAPLSWVSGAAGDYTAHWTVNALCATATGCHETSITYVGVGCTNTSAYGSGVAPTSGITTLATCNYLSEYSTLNGVVGATTYTLNITNAGTTTGYITVRSGSASGTLVALGNAPLTFTAPASGTYYCHWTADSICTTASGCHVTTCEFISSGGTQCSGIPNSGVASGDSSVCDVFTVATTGATLDLGVDYQWQSSTNQTSWTDIAGATDTSYTGTQAAATYYRMRSICTNTNDTIYSTDWQIVMNPPLSCYCIPQSTYGCSVGDLIARVILNTLDNNSGTACPSGTTGYSDYSQDSLLTTTLLPSTSYDCKVFTGAYAQGMAVWIDYNDDGVFDNVTERLGYSNGEVPANDSATFAVTLSCTPPAGQHRLRVRSMYFTTGINVDPCVANFYGEVEDYTITIAPPPPCPSPGVATVPAVTASTADLMWLLSCSSASQFDIEYGPIGFTQGTGTMLSAVSPTISNDTVTYSLAGLNSFTQYSVYIRAYCDSSNQSSWSASTDFTTACSTFAAPYWIDSVEAHTPTMALAGSNCWDATPSATTGAYDWNITGTGTTGSVSTGPTSAHSGTNFFYTEASFGTTGDSTVLYSPMIDIDTSSASLEFYYHMYGSTMGELYVEVYDTAWTIIDSIIGQQQTAETDPWLYRGISLANYTGVIQFRFVAIKSGGTSYYGDICLDDIAVNICIPNPGTDGSADVCRLSDTVDLASMITAGESTGNWLFPSNPSILNNSLLTVTTLPVGTYEAYYVVNTACVSDTTTATFTVYGPSQAGYDAVDTLCRNEPYNLLSSLSGTVDLGGYWIDPSNNTIPALITSSNLAGSYNYYYITDNGVCPADSANVLIIVDGSCDYLWINEGELSELNIYPNPTFGKVYLFSSTITDVYNLDITDVNGRVVFSSEKMIKQNQEVSIDLSTYESGIYFIRVFNDSNERNYRVVVK